MVLTVEEVRNTLRYVQGTPRLTAGLRYGAGLRVAECMTLRIKDLDFGAGTVAVRNGKRANDRTTVLRGKPTRPL